MAAAPTSPGSRRRSKAEKEGLDYGRVSEAHFAAGHIEDEVSLGPVSDLFALWNPGLRFGTASLSQEETWTCSPGARVCWIQDGTGEVFLPAGYRTKEGDGEPLPESYRPEPARPEWLEAVLYAQSQLGSLRGEPRNAVQRICSRMRGDVYVGDAANELWTWIEHHGEAPGEKFADFIALFERIYDSVGFSRKLVSSWEPVQAGDQILGGADPLRVRGNFRYWFIDTPAPLTHISALRRLRYLKDTAGGCNFQFDAFRRMSLTYYANRGVTSANPDGVNQLNSHFVNIAAETSRAHYHPRVAIGGGKPQSEMYLVMDPSVYGLSTYGRKASVTLYPEVEGANAHLAERADIPLRVGSVVYITPGTGHRGVDVFANVLVLPAYKPKNQFFFAERD